MRGRTRLALATALLAVAVVAPSPTAAAQQDPAVPPGEEVVHSWALSPGGSDVAGDAGNRSTFTYEAPPGAVIDDELTLYNYSNVPLTFRLYATDAFNNEEGDFALLPGDEEPSDVGTWIDIPQTGIVVPARSQASMPITVTIPPDVDPGDHAGAILASSTARGTGADGKVVDVDRRTGSRVYIRVAGALNPDLAIENVETNYKPALNPMSGTAEVTYRIRNRGNVRLGGEHRVSVAAPFGLGRQQSEMLRIDEILPGEEVTFTTELAGVPAGILDNTVVELTPFAAGDAEETLERVTRNNRSLAIPVTIVGLLVAFALARYARRQYRRHRDHELAPARARAV